MLQFPSFLAEHDVVRKNTRQRISNNAATCCVCLGENEEFEARHPTCVLNSVQFNTIYFCSSDPEGGCNSHDIEHVDSIELRHYITLK